MNIDHDLKEICYIQGYQTLKNRGVALLGISPGNSYFKQSTISELIDFSVNIFSKIYIVVPDKPYEHTYRALGYTNVDHILLVVLLPPFSLKIFINSAHAGYFKLPITSRGVFACKFNALILRVLGISNEALFCISGTE